MHANQQLLDDFYRAFARRDGAAMAACYADDARFGDPVFPDLRGARIGAMWQMLCERAKDFELTHEPAVADAERGSVAWVARYTFSATGRKVTNRVTGRFTFRGDRIATHRDDFSFWTWSRQALGASGLLLGWTPLVRGKVQQRAAAGLAAYTAES